MLTEYQKYAPGLVGFLVQPTEERTGDMAIGYVAAGNPPRPGGVWVGLVPSHMLDVCLPAACQWVRDSEVSIRMSRSGGPDLFVPFQGAVELLRRSMT